MKIVVFLSLLFATLTFAAPTEPPKEAENAIDAAGLKLRNEIYAPGGSRDIDVSIHNFLGRDRSIQPFLKTLGLGAPGEAKGGPSSESNLGAAKPPKP